MAEIIENEEIDKDTVSPEELEQQFSEKYSLFAEVAVSLKKSYINKLAGTRSLKLAASQTDHSIEVYQLSETSLSRVCRLSGHPKGLTEVVFSPTDDNMLFSAGLDGVIRMWDVRKGGMCTLEYKDEDEPLIRPYECMDVSCNGRVLCAGSQLVQDDAYLVFFDQRQPKPLGGYWNSHTDDVTQVKFHNDKTEILVSGSIDGLLNVYNITEETEDDALLFSLNVENSVEKVTWLDERRVSCVTQSDELQLWDVAAGDLLRTYAREKVARSIRRSRCDDCYLVDTFMSADNTAVLLAGSNSDNGHVLRSVSITDKRLQPRTDFAQNKQIVRCCSYYPQHDVLITAGESGWLSAWRRAPRHSDVTALPAHNTHHRTLPQHRHKPY